MDNNIILSIIEDADSYKASHFLQYPKSTKNVSSYIESRCDFPRKPELVGKYGHAPAVFLGVQYYVKKYLSVPITKEMVYEARDLIEAHGEPFNFDGWMSIVTNHGGFLPLVIQALPEGTLVPTGVPMVQVKASVDGFGWLVSYIETALLRSVWYPTTVATLSREIKVLITDYLIRTGEPLDGLPFMLHDFGSRGVSSQESAGLGGMAHLVNFMGTDTLAGLIYARKIYGADMPGFSIIASEHSTITTWGVKAEADAYRNMLKIGHQRLAEGKPAIIACVSDSYDIYNAVENIWGGVLRDEVIAFGKAGGKLVIRPDSGTPEIVVPKILKLLEQRFGTTKNKLGFKRLPEYLAVIQGDGINYNSIDRILKAVTDINFSPINLAFGMGGALLQQVNRDTLSFAMKANAIDLGSGWTPVFKNPVTDSGKASKAGRQAVIRKGGVLKSVGENDQKNPEDYPEFNNQNELKIVYEAGVVKIWSSFDRVRARAA